jgi:hypothetical protein
VLDVRRIIRKKKYENLNFVLASRQAADTDAFPVQSKCFYLQGLREEVGQFVCG